MHHNKNNNELVRADHALMLHYDDDVFQLAKPSVLDYGNINKNQDFMTITVAIPGLYADLKFIEHLKINR